MIEPRRSGELPSFIELDPQLVCSVGPPPKTITGWHVSATGERMDKCRIDRNRVNIRRAIKTDHGLVPVG